MNQGSFKDHFSGHAGDYARHRPRYPAALFDWLAEQVPGHELAWDAGTGNGQAALALAAHFRRVHATDASALQLAHAAAHPRVRYAVEAAERCSLADASADLVTVGQALHWFELEAFYAEVRRVLRPGGLIAAWTYLLTRVDEQVDGVVAHLYRDVVGACWPPERAHVEAAYRDLAFPFREIDGPRLELRVDWRLPEFVAYLRTWSAVARYRERYGEDPLAQVAGALASAWGAPGERRQVVWPLALRAGYA